MLVGENPGILSELERLGFEDKNELINFFQRFILNDLLTKLLFDTKECLNQGLNCEDIDVLMALVNYSGSAVDQLRNASTQTLYSDTENLSGDFFSIDYNLGTDVRTVRFVPVENSQYAVMARQVGDKFKPMVIKTGIRDFEETIKIVQSFDLEGIL
ncbi:hypothetical protein M0R04_02345 [Candidatus Dojkabacteria bacterium]|jgi:hypothetical protein|nr:hypothetical protein [Candidatus Dojkabacteria bacterium]